MATKRLVDLYVLGEEVSFDDPEGAPIVVYLKKLQPFEQEVCMNRANMERAKTLVLKRKDKDDDEVLLFAVQLDDNFTPEEVISFVSAEDVTKAYKSAEAMIAEKEEWAKEDFLVGLQEAWEDGLKDHFHLEEYPDKHAEALNVFEQLKKFTEQVDEEFDIQRKRIQREFEVRPADELRAIAIDKLIEMKADMRWLNEFRRSQIWQATRVSKKNAKDKYFESRAEVDDIHPDILETLLAAYDRISIKPDEGKG